MSGLSGYLMKDDCGSAPSSIASLKIMSLKEVVSATYDAGTKRWTALAVDTGSVFKEYQFKSGEAELKIAPTTENRITKWTSTIIFRAEKLSDKILDSIEEFAEHSYCGMVAEVTTFYDERYFIGFDRKYKGIGPLELQGGGELTTGRGLSGQQGGDITLLSETPNRPNLFDDALNVPV